jgi:hypothetical protein
MNDDNIHTLVLSYQYVGDKYIRQHEHMEITEKPNQIARSCFMGFCSFFPYMAWPSLTKASL